MDRIGGGMVGYRIETQYAEHFGLRLDADLLGMLRVLLLLFII